MTIVLIIKTVFSPTIMDVWMDAIHMTGHELMLTNLGYSYCFDHLDELMAVKIVINFLILLNLSK